VEGGVDDYGPGGANFSGENETVPQVDEQGTVDVGQDVLGGSFAEHDLVHECPPIAVGKVELSVGL
jgi:hypothetical protein